MPRSAIGALEGQIEKFSPNQEDRAKTGWTTNVSKKAVLPHVSVCSNDWPPRGTVAQVDVDPLRVTQSAGRRFWEDKRPTEDGLFFQFPQRAFPLRSADRACHNGRLCGQGQGGRHDVQFTAQPRGWGLGGWGTDL